MTPKTPGPEASADLYFKSFILDLALKPRLNMPATATKRGMPVSAMSLLLACRGLYGAEAIVSHAIA